jgi:hypothetical protein
VNYENSGKIIGSEYIEKNGGDFEFQVSYLDKASGLESELSKALKVSIEPKNIGKN